MLIYVYVNIIAIFHYNILEICRSAPSLPTRVRYGTYRDKDALSEINKKISTPGVNNREVSIT